MKKMILMLSIIASAFTLASCSSCGSCCPTPCAQPAPCPCAVAHDYKGEVGK